MKILLMLIVGICIYADNINYNKYFQNCDDLLDNGVFKTCYNREYKSSTASFIEVKSEHINTNNISKRPLFYSDKSIPEQFRTKTTDYTKTGFDRGHIQSDASNDYNLDTLKLTYAMTNITMQYPKTNRVSYFAVEKRERELTQIYGNIKALTIIHYSSLIVNNIRVPSEFIKVFFNEKFYECYIIKNDNIKYKLEDMLINCTDLNL